AARIEHHGLGLIADWQTVTALGLGELMDRIVSEPRYQEAARRMSRAFQERESLSPAVELVEKLAGGRPGSYAVADGGLMQQVLLLAAEDAQTGVHDQNAASRLVLPWSSGSVAFAIGRMDVRQGREGRQGRRLAGEPVVDAARQHVTAGTELIETGDRREVDAALLIDE